MTLWTIVPVKPFNEGKSRLAAHLSPRQRRALNRELLTRTLAAISQAHLDAQILVVSRDNRALAAAKRAGIRALAEESQPRTAPPPSSPNDAESELQLNAALTQAAHYAATHGATKVLVLPTDMPNLTAEDVRAMASPTNRTPQIIIAPSRDGGTNALMLQPAQAIHARLIRVQQGNLDDHKQLDSVLFELRFRQRPGYRIYFCKPRLNTIMLLHGGTKKKQPQDIEKARFYIEEYLEHQP